MNRIFNIETFKHKYGEMFKIDQLYTIDNCNTHSCDTDKSSINHDKRWNFDFSKLLTELVDLEKKFFGVISGFKNDSKENSQKYRLMRFFVNVIIVSSLILMKDSIWKKKQLN